MTDEARRMRELRLRAQGLTGPQAADVGTVARRLVGVQAQELAFARLAFRPRCTRAVIAADVDAALRDRTLVWTWAMRGTLHLVPAEDAGWLVGLLGPIFAARGRPRRLALGLDDARCERACALIRDVLASEGPQTRSALAQRVGIEPRGQAPAHLLGLAAMRGLVQRVPATEGREPTFALLGVPRARLTDDEALARLGQRYLDGHAPATAADLAAWSGIGLRRARRALDLLGAGTDARPRAPRGTARPHVALLGHFDPYLLGYASRDLALDPRFARRIQSGGGFVAPAVLVDGRVAGMWRREEREWLEPFHTLPDDVLEAIGRERADVVRYLSGVA